MPVADPEKLADIRRNDAIMNDHQLKDYTNLDFIRRG